MATLPPLICCEALDRMSVFKDLSVPEDVVGDAKEPPRRSAGLKASEIQLKVGESNSCKPKGVHKKLSFLAPLDPKHSGVDSDRH